MREQILAQLTQLEVERGITIDFAVEAGSRTWGYASDDSDYDVHFLFHSSKERYLRFTDPPETIEVRGAVIDMAGHDLYKFLGLLQKGNPSITEWVRSPDVYIDRRGIKDLLQALALRYPNRRALFGHYFNFARKNYQQYIINRGDETVRYKKYLHVIRPILMAIWLDRYDTIPPLSLTDLLAGVELRQNIGSLIALKGQEGPALNWVNNWIDLHLTTIKAKDWHDPQIPVEVLDYLIQKVLA